MPSRGEAATPAEVARCRHLSLRSRRRQSTTSSGWKRCGQAAGRTTQEARRPRTRTLWTEGCPPPLVDTWAPQEHRPRHQLATTPATTTTAETTRAKASEQDAQR